MKGDFTNLSLTADLDLRELKVLQGGVPGTPLPGATLPPLPVPSLPTAPLPKLPKVPVVPTPTTTPQNPLCPPLCTSEQQGRDTSWTTLYGGGAA
jgi:phospholipid/cholesterol/gamma-HCH transport system substrate-binding protein